MKEYEMRPKELFEQFLELSGKDIEKYFDKDGSALEEFQNFLAKHKLSSHCWIKARKPEQ